MIFYIDTIDVIGIIIIFVGVCVLSPTMLFALHQFYLIRGSRILKFRISPIIIAMNILIVLGILERAYHSVIVLWEIENETALSTVNAERTFIGVLIPSIYLLIALRTWLFHFEQRYQLSVASAAWKRLINERAGSWFIAHRQTLGNWKYLLRAGCLPSLCYIALCVAAEIVVVNHWTPRTATTSVVMAGSWTLHALPLLFSCVIYYRFHSKELKDLYRISTEIKYQCATIVVYEVLKVTDVVFFVAESVSTDPLILRDLGRLEAVCSFAINCFFLFALSVFTSAYPVYIHLMTDHGLRLSELMTNSGRTRGPRPRYTGISNIGEVIRHKEGFKALMNHLLLEFSTENLLFLVELIQIKYAFQLKNSNVVIIPRLKSTLCVPPCIEEESETHSEMMGDDKFAVLDFNALAPVTTLSSTRSNTVDSDPVMPRKLSPLELSDDEKPRTDEPSPTSEEPSPTAASTDGGDDPSPSQTPKHCAMGNVDLEHIDFSNKIEPDSPPPTFQSAFVSGFIRQLSDAREMTKTAYFHTAAAPKRSKSRTAPKPLKVCSKLPGMFTYLFRDDTLIMKLELPPGLPPSTALEDVDGQSSLSLQFEYIFRKFIRPGALHEVNLPYQIRSDLCTFFEHRNTRSFRGTRIESFIFNIFDEAALQILELMVDSFGRFASTAECQRIQREIGRDCSSSGVSCGSYIYSKGVVRHFTSLSQVMHQYEISSCNGFSKTRISEV